LAPVVLVTLMAMGPTVPIQHSILTPLLLSPAKVALVLERQVASAALVALELMEITMAVLEELLPLKAAVVVVVLEVQTVLEAQVEIQVVAPLVVVVGAEQMAAVLVL